MPKKENGFHLTQTLKKITLRLLLNSLTCYEIHVEKMSLKQYTDITW